MRKVTDLQLGAKILTQNVVLHVNKLERQLCNARETRSGVTNKKLLPSE